MASNMNNKVSSDPLVICGCQLAATAAGIRYRDRPDLVLMAFDEEACMAGVFTRNAFCAAPVKVAREHLRSGRYLLINAGNANAGTGAAGEKASRESCEAVAELFSAQPSEVLPFSTGVIGEQLPVAKIRAALPGLKSALQETGWHDAAQAIMTTDTRPKIASLSVALGDTEVGITGIVKGSGMIHPNMATMLAFIVTDAKIPSNQLDDLNQYCAERSFNRISVDGDTSTNDACMLVATGAKKVDLDNEEDLKKFQQALLDVYTNLAKQIVLDGEGATKFVTLDVRGGATSEECLKVARTVACSPLVKTAWYASDPNWGRMLAAVGNANLADLQTEKVAIFVDDVSIVAEGGLNPDYREEQGQEVFSRNQFTVRIELGRGTAREELWTCDLSHDYVSINADYRS